MITKPKIFHLLPVVIFASGLGISVGTTAARELPDPVVTFLDQHCLECHDEFSAEGGLDLFATPFDLENADHFETWVHVHDRIRRGEMPPQKKERPDPEELATITDWLSDELTSWQEKQQEENGRVVLRRLNRVEYENTLRDLLELPGLEIAEVLPPDAEAHGFDNVGEALRVSYVQVNRYLEASRQALREAAWLAPEITPWDFRLPFTEIHRFQITRDLTRLDGKAVLLRQPNTAQTPWRLNEIEIPFPGTHTMRIRARAATYEKEKDEEAEEGKLVHSEDPQIVSVYQGTRLLGSFELGPEFAVLELKAWLHPRERLFLHVPTLQDWNPKWKPENAYSGPAVVLDWCEISGPEEAAWPTKSYRALFDELPTELWTEASGTRPPEAMGEPKHPKRRPKLKFPHKKNRYHVVSASPAADAARLLHRFAKRAFRREVSLTELEPYLDLVKSELARMKPFHEALLTGYVGLLSSPDFLYFREEPGKLDPFALATRLSYFLWKSPPDETLLAKARAGNLGKAEVLRAEVERLLEDDRSARFVKDFTDQWLSLRDIRATQPDDKLYPEFDDYLLESMIRESRAYFQEMIHENLPARATVASDFVFANNALAELYGLGPVGGTALQKVTLPPDSPRGGFLTQAAILKVTANGTTTSPVVRGSWVLEHLLGTPPSPPPPDIPAVEPDTRGTTTMRELLAKHSSDKSCATCHQHIDPPGFALENFDVIGGWREHYRSQGMGKKVNRVVDFRPVSYRLGPPVDPSATLADGRSFSDIRGFRDLLLEEERQLARNLVERLVTYATGAGISFADRRAVEVILDRSGQGYYGLRTLIHQVVASDLFQKK